MTQDERRLTDNETDLLLTRVFAKKKYGKGQKNIVQVLI